MNAMALWIALAALLLSCFFAACSGALRAYSRSKLSDLLDEQGRGDRFDPFVARTPKLLLMAGTLRTALNMIVLLCAIWFLESMAAPWRYVTAFAAAGVLICIFAVAVPMSLARYHAERLLARAMSVLNVCLVPFLPIVNFLHLFDPIVRRVVAGDESAPKGEDLLTEEILSVVEDHEQDAKVDEHQKDMLEGVIELRSTTAEQIMTPRTEVKGIEVDATLAQVKAGILEVRHSRIPVYRESLDNIVGVLYAKDMIRYLGDGEAWDIEQVIRKPFMVPETKSISELLTEFRARKVHMAIVLDEYGGTAGLITIEDILEEIVGEIQDEYEPGEEPPTVKKTSDTTADVDARVRVNDLNDELDLQLPEDEDYDTVGGFVFAQLGHIPEVGETVEFQNIKMTVVDAQQTKVNRVSVEIVESQMTARNGKG